MGTINLKVPDDLRNKYKALCALNRTTMQADLLRYIQTQVARKEEKR